MAQYGGGGFNVPSQPLGPKVEEVKDLCKKVLTELYLDQLQEIANRDRKVLVISIQEIIDKGYDNEQLPGFGIYDLGPKIKENTLRHVHIFEEAADELLENVQSTIRRTIKPDIFDILQAQRDTGANEFSQMAKIKKGLARRYEVSIVPDTIEKPRKLREIKAADIGKLVTIKGMVTRATDVKPLIKIATYTCDNCGTETFQDISQSEFMPLHECTSKRCKENNSSARIQMQTRGSKFIKYQELRIQELPDQVPVGHIPRAMTVHCKGEQTRLCGPGDVVTISGIFLTVSYKGFKAMKAGLQADTYIDASLIEKQKQSYDKLDEQLEHHMAVREISTQVDPYTRLAASIAPEIFGHEDVKKALLLQLVGGSTRVLPDGMRIRGDINICLMGDPGVAKSQLLKYISSVAPRGVYTTGKGSSGVGLTAAVVLDKVTGDMALEGGALVLADMGICCIDEFDKMEESDRTAIHEVMEQQTISIAKAGITTTLNARAAVLAAANPKRGRYDKTKSIADNIDLPNSLLSRFDLLFLILDKADMEQDLALSKHVLYVHKHRKNPEKEFSYIEPAVIKKYIAVARTFTPSVPRDLTTYIVEHYVTMRAEDHGGHSGRYSSRGNDQAAMTPRLLLSILRLSQALARLRLSSAVTHEDVDEAIRLTRSSKASLEDDGQKSGNRKEDDKSIIYSMIRDHASQRGSDTVEFAQIEAMVVKKGFSVHALQSCLLEYQSLGVLELDAEKRFITIGGI